MSISSSDGVLDDILFELQYSDCTFDNDLIRRITGLVSSQISNGCRISSSHNGASSGAWMEKPAFLHIDRLPVEGTNIVSSERLAMRNARFIDRNADRPTLLLHQIMTGTGLPLYMVQR